MLLKSRRSFSTFPTIFVGGCRTNKFEWVNNSCSFTRSRKKFLNYLFNCWRNDRGGWTDYWSRNFSPLLQFLQSYWLLFSFPGHLFTNKLNLHNKYENNVATVRLGNYWSDIKTIKYTLTLVSTSAFCSLMRSGSISNSWKQNGITTVIFRPEDYLSLCGEF